MQQLSVAAQRAWQLQLQLQQASLLVLLAAAAASVLLLRGMHWAVVWQHDNLQQSQFLLHRHSRRLAPPAQ
jgi:hypothetical protein